MDFDRSTAIPAVLVGVVFVSLSAILIRYSTAPALVIASYRMVFSFLLLLPFARFRGFAALARRDLILVLISGVFLGAHFAAWISSIQRTSVAHSTVLVTIHPVVVVTYESIRSGEFPRRGTILAVGVSLVGAVILSLGSSSGGVPVTVAGDALALVGALAVAVYILIGKEVRDRVPAGMYNTLVYLVAALVLIPFAFAGHDLFGPWEPIDYGVFFGLAFFCTLLGHSVLNWALKYLTASFISLAILLEPVFASILALLLFTEVPSLLSLVGALLVITGLAAITRSGIKQDY